MLVLSVLLANCVAICLHIYSIFTCLRRWKGWIYILIQIWSILTQIFCIAGVSLIIPIYPSDSYIGDTLFDFAGILYIGCSIIIVSIDLKVLTAFDSFDLRLKIVRSIYFRVAFYFPYLLCFLGHTITFCLLDIAKLNQYVSTLNLMNELLSIVTSLQTLLLDTLTAYIVFKSLSVTFRKKFSSNEGRRDFDLAKSLVVIGVLIDYGALIAYVVTIIEADLLHIIIASDFGTASVSLHIFLLQITYQIIMRMLRSRGDEMTFEATKSTTVPTTTTPHPNQERVAL